MLDNLYFLHIPKTAGTSIRYWLLDLFSSDDYLECFHLKPLQQQALETLESHRFFSGHFGLKLHEILSRKPKTITWLRDPIDREISQYFYLRANAKEFREHVDDPVSSIHPFSSRYLDAVLTSGLPQLCQNEHPGYCDNLQVRYLAGLSPGTQEIKPCTQETLEIAKENLRNLDHFGICEWMQASIDAFCYKFFLPPHKFSLYLNKRSQKRGNLFSDQDLSTIRESNKYDIELYQFAQELFHERFEKIMIHLGVMPLEAIVPSKKEISDNITQLNTIDLGSEKKSSLSNERYYLSLEESVHSSIDKLFRNKSVSPITKSRQILFSEANHLIGWYPRQYYKPYRSWIRWAGPNTSSMFYLPLLPETYRISVPILIQKNPNVIDKVKICINSHEVVLNKIPFPLKTGEIKFLLTGIIEKGYINSDENYSLLRIETEEVFPQKNSINDNEKVRHVSFATNGFWIEPMCCIPNPTEIICLLESSKTSTIEQENFSQEVQHEKNLDIATKKMARDNYQALLATELLQTLICSLESVVRKADRRIERLNVVSQKEVISLEKTKTNMSKLNGNIKNTSRQINHRLSRINDIQDSINNNLDNR